MEELIRVLIVDHQRPMRQWVRSKLESSGQFEIVGEAGDGYDAVEKAQAQNPDLVLLDIGVPGLNGIETAVLLRRVAPHARILFLSQNNDPELKTTALKDGGIGYVFKAEAETHLLSSIKAAGL